MSRAGEFSCKNCSSVYTDKSNLSRHYRKYPGHKSSEDSRQSSEEACKVFLSNCSAYHRRARLRQLAKELSHDDLEAILPIIATNISTFEFMMTRCSNRYNIDKNYALTKIVEHELTDLHGKLLNQFPVLTNISLSCSSKVSTTNIPKYQNITCFIDDMHYSSANREKEMYDLMKSKPSLAAENMIQIDSCKNAMMMHIQKNFKEAFLEFDIGILTSCSISQRQYQDIFRNHWGRKLNERVGLNPFLPKDIVINELNKTKQTLQQEVGLKFITDGEIVSAYTDISKHLEFLLKEAGDALSFPNGNMIIYDYMDEFSFMGWSSFYTGETSIQIKIVEPHNLLSFVLRAGMWIQLKNQYSTRLQIQIVISVIIQV